MVPVTSAWVRSASVRLASRRSALLKSMTLTLAHAEARSWVRWRRSVEMILRVLKKEKSASIPY